MFAVSLSVCPLYVSVCPLFVCPSVCLGPSVYLSVRLSVCLSDCLSVRLFVCPSVYLHVCLSVCLLSVYMYVHLHTCQQNGSGSGIRLISYFYSDLGPLKKTDPDPT